MLPGPRHTCPLCQRTEPQNSILFVDGHDGSQDPVILVLFANELSHSPHSAHVEGGSGDQTGHTLSTLSRHSIHDLFWSGFSRVFGRFLGPKLVEPFADHVTEAH